MHYTGTIRDAVLELAAYHGWTVRPGRANPKVRDFTRAGDQAACSFDELGRIDWVKLGEHDTPERAKRYALNVYLSAPPEVSAARGRVIQAGQDTARRAADAATLAAAVAALGRYLAFDTLAAQLGDAAEAIRSGQAPPEPS